ncbi:NAF1-domain-containing protein, partial [Trichocladium antarcticum]
MAGMPFQIPGLGQARPNEQLPAENFAPDLLAAAASIMGEDDIALGATNGNAQLEKNRQQQKKEEVPQAAEPAATVGRAEDSMDVDSGTSTASGTVIGDSEPTQIHNTSTKSQSVDVDMETSNDAPPSPSVTHALEAALNGMLGPAMEATEQTQQRDAAEQLQQPSAGNAEQAQGQEQAEWEADSSPYESSSESSSSDSSSDDDSEGEGGYPLLGIEETARLLMATDGDGDDGTGKPKGGPALRTKNEITEEVIPKPDVTITPEMRIEPLGNIEFIVESTIVIKSQTPGEVQVLDSGSVLCKQDRTVIGALAEVLGNVRNPMYTVGFSTEDDIKALELAVGMPVFYSVAHANYVFTQPLKEVKGTDASNLHDEELAVDEMEFSDDEKEAEYKRQQKLKKRGGKAGRGGRDQSSHPGSTHSPHPGPGAGLNYDEDEDGPYRPLTRPAGFGQGGPPSLPPLPPKPETGFSPPRGGRARGNRGTHRGGRGDFRGRGSRGGSRGGDRRHGQRGGGSG